MMKLNTAVAFSLLGMILFSGTSQANCTFSLTSEQRSMKTVDMPPVGFSLGDMVFFYSDLIYQGKTIGTVIVDTQTDRMPNATAANTGQYEERLTIAQYHTGGVDSIVTIGDFFYPNSNSAMAMDIPQVRAVSGGTGKFKFARGQVTITRTADSTYQHLFELDVKPSLCKFLTAPTVGACGSQAGSRAC